MCGYKGSKAKWVDQIWTPILDDLENNKGFIVDYEKTTYVELFCGGFGLGARLPFKNRIANDINPYVIAYLSRIAEETDWLLEPEFWNIDKEKYNFIRENFKLETNLFSPSFLGYVGICYSYGYSFFQGYNSTKNETPQTLARRAYNHALEDHALFKNTRFLNLDYKDVPIPPGSIVYCDVPYDGTSNYGYHFDLQEFIEYFKYLRSQGNYVYLSEVKADMPLGLRQIGQFYRPITFGNGSIARRKSNLLEVV